MRIGIFGSNGMLGGYLSRYLTGDLVTFTRTDLDVETATLTELEHFLKYHKCDIIINSVGLIPQRGSNKLARYIKVNTIFPQWLSILASTLNYKLIHITTDCVYSGARGDYSEDDIADETNYYGVTKYYGENERACIIRTSIIGEEVFNKRSLLEWVRSNANGQINGFTNHHWNGVTCLELTRIIDMVIHNDSLWTGVRHIFSNVVSKYDLLKMINEVYDLNIEIIPYICDKAVNKTLTTKYDKIKTLDLFEQIKELKNNPIS